MYLCRIEGCDKPVRIKSRGWCQMHYTRWLRHGDPSFRLADLGSVTSHGYLMIRKQYAHRSVLLEKIGPGSHPCHWCEKPVTWGVDLEVDHLDSDKLNNDPSNLAPSCHRCNTRRAVAGKCNVPWESRPRGESHHRAKLTDEAVAEIRLSTESQRSLAVRYAVSKTTIANVRRYQVWKHVA